MPNCHPLQSQGNSQLGRLIKSLQASAFQLDERTTQDMIEEAYRFAQSLKFFDETDTQPILYSAADKDEEKQGKPVYWDRFWEVETITFLAIVAATDTEDFKRQYYNLNERITTPQSAFVTTGEKKGKEIYLPLLAYLQQLAVSLDDVYTKLVLIKHPLQSLLLNRIRRDNCCDQEELEGALVKLIGYHKGTSRTALKASYSIFYNNKSYWGINNEFEYDAIRANPHFSLEDLYEIFQTFFQTWIVLKNAAQANFDAELAKMELLEEVEYRIVQPHIVLFLVFLRLFRYAQESLNGLVIRHLDYYYEEILGMKRRAEVSDEVFLLFELAKDFDQYFLEKGTLFQGGKDKNGQPILYESIEDWVLRAAQVTEIKNTWIDAEGGGIHGNPDVKKRYLEGSELPNESAQQWRTMGDDANLPDAELGFAIASPQLILREGKRVIDVEITLDENTPWSVNDEAQEYFQVLLSSNDNWIKPVFDSKLPVDSIPELIKGAYVVKYVEKKIHFRIVLERDDLPVVSLSGKLAGESGLKTQWPIVKVVVNPSRKKDVINTFAIYNTLRSLKANKIDIKVDVSGIRENLIIQSDQGVFDGTQKILPFGPTPAVGNKLYIGSTEVFQKALDKLVINFEWLAPPSNYKAYYGEYAVALPNKTPLPEPSVQIDFVDRADTPKPKQVVRFGERTDGVLSGNITDIYNKALKDIDVRIVDGKNTQKAITRSDEFGKYTLNVPVEGGVLNIEFIPPIQKADVKDIDLFEPLLYMQIEDKAENTTTATKSKISIEKFSEINVVLFPKNIKFDLYKSIDSASILGISGVITDIYNKPVNQIEVSGGGDKKNTDSTGAFKLEAPDLPASIEIKLPTDSPFEALPSSLLLDGFSELKIKLEPKEYLKEGSGSLDIAKPIEGSMKGTSVIDALDSAFVEALGSSIKVTAFTNNGGYKIPLPDANSTLEYYPDTYANSNQSRKKLAPQNNGKPNSNQIDATLFAPQQIKKVFINKDSIVKIEVIDHLKRPLTNVSISSTNTSSIDKNDEPNGIYNVKGVTENFTLLTFSAPGYESLLNVDIGRYQHLKIMLYPINGEERVGNIGTDEIIRGQIVDRDGNNIKGVAIKVTNPSTTLSSPTGDYTIKASGKTTIEFSKSGFATKELELDNDKPAVLNVVLDVDPDTLKNSKDKITDTISGIIYDASGQKLSGVKTFIEGNNGNYIKIETLNPTGTIGVYTLNKLQGINNPKLSLVKDGFLQKLSPIFAKQDLIFLNQIHRGSVNPSLLQGKVQDVNGQSITGVSVRNVRTNSKVFTSSTGSFFINPPADNQDYQIEFQHDAYKKLVVNIESGCTEIHIKLIPENVFRVLKGQITDIYNSPLSGVSINIENTSITSQSNETGNYELLIPANLEEKIKFSFSSGFESLLVDLKAAYDNTSGDFTRSIANIVLYYFSINLVSLLDESKGMKSSFPVNINSLNLSRDVRTQEFEKYSPTLKRGFVNFTLVDGDFLHEEYAKVLTIYSLFTAGEVQLPDSKGVMAGFNKASFPIIPNAPYTPATNNISVNYVSSQTISGKPNLDNENNPIDQFFQILPFNGHKTIPIEPEELKLKLVYPYLPDDTAEVSTKFTPGNLFLGISNLQPGSNLALLFEIAPGSAPDPEADLPEIKWSYLAANNQWKPFTSEKIIQDQTFRLTRSGIIQFAIPTDAAKENTMLNPEYFWLRAAAIGNARSLGALPDMKSIRAQVVQVKFKNTNNELSHLAQPLPSGTIGNLLESRTAVKKIEQPLASFAGRLPESVGYDYYIRVSERLRHKDRAVTAWDYEKLLLQQFDLVAIAKCIPHTRYKPLDGASELAPGHISVAVIPQLKISKGGPWPEPRFSQGELNDMRVFLITHSNLFVGVGEAEQARLQIVNPLYEKVDVKVEVSLADPKLDKVFFQKQLKTELEHYLSPWLADNSKAPFFGRKLQRSSILQFIEERTYVDYVEVESFEISMLKLDVAGQSINQERLIILESICPNTARSILVKGNIEVSLIENTTQVASGKTASKQKSKK